MGYYIYVLVLEHENYFIGRSNDLLRRLHDHSMGFADEWTRIHKPLFAERVIENTQPTDLENLYQVYLNKFGSEHVRKDEY